MQEKDMSVKSMSEKMKINSQSLSNKLYRDTFTYNEIIEMANLLNCDVKIIMRDTGKEFY
jgi:lambda repressor-like predicted transcriptional regulator